MRRSSGAGLLAITMVIAAGVAEAGDEATLSILSVSTSTAQPGGRVDFSATVLNSGTTTWSPTGNTFSPTPSSSGGLVYPNQSGYYYFQLEYFYLDAANPFDPNASLQSLVPMPGVLGPGQSTTVTSYFFAPQTPGRWGFTVQMVKNYVYAFEDQILSSPSASWNTSPRFEFVVSTTPPPADPGMTSTLRLVSGTVAGQAVSPGSRTVTVSPGTSLIGQLNVRIDSTYGSSSVMAMAATPTWGSHSTSFTDVGGFSTPASNLTRTVPITLTAPSTPGTYYVIVAYRAEYTAAQVMSCTNWAVGSPVWNDGNDVADWGAGTIATANANGTVSAPYSLSGGTSVYVPATAVQVIVSGGGTPCVTNSTILCIDGQPGDHRFEVKVSWQTAQGGGQSGAGTAVPTAPIGFSRGGIFWFFDSTNPEMLVKIVNGCSVNGMYWVFASAGTNVGLTVNVKDTATGGIRAYVNPDLTAALPVQDVAAFSCGAYQIGEDPFGD